MENKLSRERFTSRLGFIFMSAGCAIGCGNIWKFPWMVGQNGGGIFVLIYAFFLVVLGLPCLVMEFSLGRASQASPIKMYNKLEKPGQKWHIHGIVCLIGNLALMAFYTVVTSWFIFYFYEFLVGKMGFGKTPVGFVNMITNPSVNVGFLALNLIVCFFLLTFDLKSGLERVSKIMMSLLFVLMFVLVIKSGMFEGAKEGYKFYLMPDISKITLSTIVNAMNQAFFTLSIGIGAMAIFGSYIGKEQSLMKESITVILLDSLVAVMAGLIIFPACASFNIEVGAGPSLLFDTMATVFCNMNGGRLWGSLFFLFMIFAGFSTEIAVCENILACLREMTGITRKKGSIICGIVVFLLSLTTALGFSVIKFHPFGEGSSFMDFWDFIVSMNLLPLGALIIALFCCSDRFGWGWNNFMQEVNSGKGMKVHNWMKPIFKFIVPILILIVYILGMIFFFK